MYDLSTIRRMNDEAAKKAKKRDKQPLVLTKKKVESWKFTFPSFGSYIPPKWNLKDTLFCDSSGFGRPGEPAMTEGELKQKLLELIEEHPDYGYAVVESGQFQCHVGIFEPIPDTTA